MVELEPDPNNEFKIATDLSDRDRKRVRNTVEELIEDAINGGENAEFEVFSSDGKMLDKPATDVSEGEVIAYYPNEVDSFVTGVDVNDQKELKQYFTSGRGIGFLVASM